MQATIDEGERVDFSSIENLAQREFEQLQVPSTFTFDAGAVPVTPTLDTTAAYDPDSFDADKPILHDGSSLNDFMKYLDNKTSTQDPVVVEQQGFFSKIMDYASSAFSKVTSAFGYSGLKTTALAAATVAALAMPSYGQDCGDGDNNARVDIIDALYSAQISAGLSVGGSVDHLGEQRLDVTGPNGITILDSLRIAQFAAGLDPEGTGFLYCATDEAGLTKFYQHGDTGSHATATPVDRESSTSFVFQHYDLLGTSITVMPSMTLGDGVVYGPDGALNQMVDGLVAQITTVPGMRLAEFYTDFDTPVDPVVLTGKQMPYQGAFLTVTNATIDQMAGIHSITLEGGMGVALDGTPQTFDAGSAMWENVSATMTSPTEAMVDVNGLMLPATVGDIVQVPTMPNSYLKVTGVSPTQVDTMIEYCIIHMEDTDPTNPAYTGTFSSWGVVQPNVHTKIETVGGNISRIVQAIDEPMIGQPPRSALVDPEGGNPLETLLLADWKGTNAYRIQFPGRVESGQTTTHRFEQDALNDDIINLTYMLPDGMTQVVMPFYGSSASFGSARFFFNIDERGSTDPHPVKEGNQFLFTAYDGLKWVSEIMTYQNLTGGNLNLLRGDGTPFQVAVGQDITIPTEGGRTASQNYEVGAANALAVNNDSNPLLEVDQQALFYLHTPGANHNHYVQFTTDISPDGSIPAPGRGHFKVVEPSELYPLGSQPSSFFEAVFFDGASESLVLLDPFGTTTTTFISPLEHKIFPSLYVVGDDRSYFDFQTTGPTYSLLDIKKVDPNP